jgi:septin family protein
MELWYNDIRQYITKQFDNYRVASKEARKKSKTQKPKIDDKRVHAILYFLKGPRINEEDVKYMKRLQKYGNIIPVIAKGDGYSKEEVTEVKKLFFEKIKNKGVELFNFESALENDQEKLEELRRGLFGPCPPFVIISSIKKIEISPGKYIYGREYPWGLCNIENPQHSDFMLLRTLLGGHIYHEAIALTESTYKNYKHDQKKRQKKQKNEEDLMTKVRLGAAVTVLGLAGTYFAVKKKLLN